MAESTDLVQALATAMGISVVEERLPGLGADHAALRRRAEGLRRRLRLGDEPDPLPLEPASHSAPPGPPA